MSDVNETESILVSSFKTSDGGATLHSSIDDVHKRLVRRRLPLSEREFIWRSTNGMCYLCKTQLPKQSSWHIEHVIAFSEDPRKNDTLGNMLPACAACNFRKNNKSLMECIQTDYTFDLATASKDISHLNTAARATIMLALNAKNELKLLKDSSNKSIQQTALVNTVMDEMELRLRSLINGVAPLAKMNISPILQKNMINESDIKYNLDDNDAVRMGSFGQVFIGQLTSNNNLKSTKTKSQDKIHTIDVAIKFPVFQTNNIFETMLHEIEMLSRFTHDCIVRFYGWFERSQQNTQQQPHNENFNSNALRFGIVMEWSSHSLNMDIAAMNINPLSVFHDITSALVYMHSLNCVHRDVKPANILIHKPKGVPWMEARAKLCDFGSAKFIFNDMYCGGHTANAGTASFRPPEVRNGKFFPESDVYSLGKSMLFVHHLNRTIQGDGILLETWQQMVQRMTINYPCDSRPSMAAVLTRLDTLLPSDQQRLRQTHAQGADDHTSDHTSDTTMTMTMTPVAMFEFVSKEVKAVKNCHSPLQHPSSAKQTTTITTPSPLLLPSHHPIQHYINISPMGSPPDVVIDGNSLAITTRKKTKTTKKDKTPDNLSIHRLHDYTTDISPVALTGSETTVRCSPSDTKWINNTTATSANGTSSCCIIVFMTTKARRHEAPRGTTAVRYHSSRDCGVLVGRELCQVSEEEAIRYKHSRCKSCRWPSSLFSPTPTLSPSPAMTTCYSSPIKGQSCGQDQCVNVVCEQDSDDDAELFSSEDLSPVHPGSKSITAADNTSSILSESLSVPLPPSLPLLDNGKDKGKVKGNGNGKDKDKDKSKLNKAMSYLASAMRSLHLGSATK
eukprot:gene8920-18459_t